MASFKVYSKMYISYALIAKTFLVVFELFFKIRVHNIFIGWIFSNTNYVIQKIYLLLHNKKCLPTFQFLTKALLPGHCKTTLNNIFTLELLKVHTHKSASHCIPPLEFLSTHLATFCAISVNAFLRSHQVQGSVQTKKNQKKRNKQRKEKKTSM